MARIQTGPLISSIAGSVRGSTFQNSKSGLIVRGKPLPRPRATARQQLNRQSLAYNRFGWYQITQAQRDLWQSFASYIKAPQKRNPSKYLNGWECFLRCNTYRGLYFLGSLAGPVFSINQPVFSFVNITSAGGNLTLNLSAAPNNTIAFLVAQSSPVLRTGSNSAPQGLRMLIFSTVNLAAQDIKLAVSNAWSIFPVPGDRIYLNLYTVVLNNGFRLSIHSGITTVV